MILLTKKSFNNYVIAVNKLKKYGADTESGLYQNGYGMIYNQINKDITNLIHLANNPQINKPSLHFIPLYSSSSSIMNKRL